MSWKGFSKAVSRLPHQVLSKTGKAEVSRDPEYDHLQKRYEEALHDTNQLAKDTYAYKDAMKALLEGQTLMGKSFNGVFAICIEKHTESSNETFSRNCDHTNLYADTMQQVQQELLPSIELLDNGVLRPLQQLQEIQKDISKTLAKHQRKKVDFDRFSHAMQKLADVGDSQPTAVHKAQTQLRQATEEYAAVDKMVKGELPQFFALQGLLTRLVERELYNFQRSIYEMLSTRITQIASVVLDQQQQERIQTTYHEALDQLESLRICGGNSQKGGGNDTLEMLGDKDAVSPNLVPRDTTQLGIATTSSSSATSIPGKEPVDDSENSDYAPSAPPLSEAPSPTTPPCSPPEYSGQGHQKV